MRFDRLEKLVAALQDADPKTFNMERYGHGCGTPACVFGHYAARRDLQHTFKLLKPKYADEYCDIDSTEGECYHDSYVVLDHFGINDYQAEELFGSEGCGGAKTPKEAITYLRGFIKTWQAREAKGQYATPARTRFRSIHRA